jgi:phosphoribosylaminoimidazole-succinocarboxamide synthase
MADARELLIKLTVDAAQADRRLKDISKSVGGLESGLRTAGSSLKSFVTGLAGAVTVGTIFAAFKNAADAMDDMVKAAAKVGTTVENLSALNYAAQQSGVSFEGLQTGLKKLNQNLVDVEKGTTDAAFSLREIKREGII